MSNNTLVNENTRTTPTTSSDGPIAHLDHMLNSLHDEQQTVTARLPTGTLDAFDNKSSHQPSRNHNRIGSTRTTITDGKIVESSSENSVIFRYYTGESGPVIDEHFEKAFKQPMTFSPARSLHSRDHRTPSYGYSGMMGTSSSFWPNFMASPTSYLHPTYLPTSQNEYNDWMHHHHHSYRSPYSTNTTATASSSSPSTGTGNHLHPIGSPNNTTNNNASRYHHHHSPPDMDVVTAAAIGAAAAAQMFHHEKQSHHGYTPSSHHFDYHLGGSMMANGSSAFPTQSFDLMGSSASAMGLEMTSNKDSATSPPWYSNPHLFC